MTSVASATEPADGSVPPRRPNKRKGIPHKSPDSQRGQPNFIPADFTAFLNRQMQSGLPPAFVSDRAVQASAAAAGASSASARQTSAIPPPLLTIRHRCNMTPEELAQFEAAERQHTGVGPAAGDHLGPDAMGSDDHIVSLPPPAQSSRARAPNKRKTTNKTLSPPNSQPHLPDIAGSSDRKRKARPSPASAGDLLASTASISTSTGSAPPTAPMMTRRSRSANAAVTGRTTRSASADPTQDATVSGAAAAPASTPGVAASPASHKKRKTLAVNNKRSSGLTRSLSSSPTSPLRHEFTVPDQNMEAAGAKDGDDNDDRDTPRAFSPAVPGAASAPVGLLDGAQTKRTLRMRNDASNARLQDFQVQAVAAA